MLMELVDQATTTWAEPDLHYQLGAIARRIHAIKSDDPSLALYRRCGSWSVWATERILMRALAAARYIYVPRSDALRSALSRVIGGKDRAPQALLHLDLRPPNLAVRDGRIVSVLDLGNAIVGDPLLELARIRGCGLLSSEFLQGYGLAFAALDQEAAVLDAYELDLALLLVVVSREEFTNEDLHAAMSRRAAILLERVIATSPS
jgi:aminoglycoside phosphotransferase (APT) family kinase protein